MNIETLELHHAEEAIEIVLVFHLANCTTPNFSRDIFLRIHQWFGWEKFPSQVMLPIFYVSFVFLANLEEVEDFDLVSYSQSDPISLLFQVLII